ncbi:MAG: efflux RND transporter periplasmic adaptor subunit [Nitrospirae bacterium]|nr:MAG: efflux RND transporter periplasmic adaptor subunit [Nitrospirota bacterium]
MRRWFVLGGLLAVFMIAVLMLVIENNDGRTVEKAVPSGQGSPAGSQGGIVPQVAVVPVIAQRLDETVRLPGELQPFLSVDLYPKVTGILDWIGVDRGSQVKKGQVLVRLTAPELTAQRVEAEAKLHSDEITHARLVAAAATPGVVAPNDVHIAQRTVEADRARVKTLQEMEGYLVITAPFDGVITTRNVHPGALVGPAGGGGAGANPPLVRLEHTAHLRLMVPVPEAYTGGIAPGQSVTFTVPAFPGQTFPGTIARIAHSIDMKTRTMPVEIDVDNPAGSLAPGMFPEVEWPVRRSGPTLFVPAKAVVTTTELTFVIRVRQETVEWVKVQKGRAVGNLVEVFGDLSAGDSVAARGTDELRPGTKVVARPALPVS